ncbi:Oxygen-insensitive NAD(P)H nitroreductase [Sinobacterium norvegicum]|uniref:Oxygen-insensitive NAD(P)H nitroreductase n=1 Tax=Sinobacterium norvegicum TaxID=1641715 RepID=A0ABM9AAT4_9GAMM|nr:nitroreductase family protein [Sinobacterium norvegicum]CAH0990308.1 Oxygen-insensitive NAD(P)H nitroreductase [Sinobacterium norvegicum]
MTDLLSALQQRYATKVYDSSKRVNQETLSLLMESLRLSPSSINSQPWHFYCVSSPEVKQMIADCSWPANQQKINDCSHVIVFAAKTSFDREDCRDIEAYAANQRGVELNEQRLSMMSGFVDSLGDDSIPHWTKHQVYLALGQFLLSAKLCGLDATPVEGFDSDALDQSLKLREQGFSSTVIALLGYGAEDDFNRPEQAAKVRFPLDQVISFID